MEHVAVEVGHGAVGDVVEVPVHLEHPGEGDHLALVAEVCVGDRAARRRAARDGHEVAGAEGLAAGLHGAEHVRHGHPLHRVVVRVPPGVGDRLEHDAPHGRVPEAELDERPGLVLVDAPLDRRHEDHVQVGLGEAVQRPELGLEEGLSPDRAVRVVGEPVELEVDQRAKRRERREPGRVVGDPQAVGVDHHVADVPALCGRDHLQQVRVDRRLSARELDDLRVALELHEPVEHRLDLGDGEVEARAGIREADRAVEVAGGVHLDQREAGVLAVLRAQAAIERAAVDALRGDARRGLAGLVELRLLHVGAGVPVDQSLEPAVLRAPLAHERAVVAQEHLGVDDDPALRADRPGRLVEDLAVRAGARRKRGEHAASCRWGVRLEARSGRTGPTATGADRGLGRPPAP